MQGRLRLVPSFTVTEDDDDLLVHHLLDSNIAERELSSNQTEVQRTEKAVQVQIPATMQVEVLEKETAELRMRLTLLQVEPSWVGSERFFG